MHQHCSNPSSHTDPDRVLYPSPAGSERPAPRFTAHTLSGEVFDNQSLSGNVVLLQFWATWCPYCRRDQPAVDKLQHAFAAKGLIVLAVNVGESELSSENTSRQIQGHVGLSSTMASFKIRAHGFPYYVLIDRQGNIAGTRVAPAGKSRSLIC